MSELDVQTTTVGDLCIAALGECGQIGVGQTALADDINKTWARLQWMLQTWARKRWLVYHLRDYAIVATGAEFYTIGPGGQIDTNGQQSYTLALLQVNAGGGGYNVGDTINLVCSPNAQQQIIQAQVLVTSVNAGAVTGIELLTTSLAGNNICGQFVGPLPNNFTQGLTSGAGVGAMFNLPVWAFLQGFNVSNANSPLSSRPNKIESAFLRQIGYTQPNQVDYPLSILNSREDYNRIRLKSLVSFPGAVFLDAGNPLGIVYAYPVPQGGGIYELHITIKEQLPVRFATLATQLILPYEYYDAILHCLAWRMRSFYRIPTYPGDPLPGLVKDSEAMLRQANTELAELVIDPNLTRQGLYNIFSDTIY